MNTERETAPGATPAPDAVLDWSELTPAEGSACALLTPAIKAKLRELAAGQTLEVRVADPSAREDIQSWARLAGHELLALYEAPPGLLHALLLKKAG